LVLNEPSEVTNKPLGYLGEIFFYTAPSDEVYQSEDGGAELGRLSACSRLIRGIVISGKYTFLD
jgi:hypothetical protein